MQHYFKILRLFWQSAIATKLEYRLDFAIFVNEESRTVQMHYFILLTLSSVRWGMRCHSCFF